MRKTTFLKVNSRICHGKELLRSTGGPERTLNTDNFCIDNVVDSAFDFIYR